MRHASFGISLISNLLNQSRFPWAIDEDVIAYWSQESSRAGKKIGNTAAIQETARHYGECATTVYGKIGDFKHGLTATLLRLSEDSTQTQPFAEAVYRDRGSNQRLRFEAAIAVAAARAQRLQLVAAVPGNVLLFKKGQRMGDFQSRESLLWTAESAVQQELLELAQSLVAAAHAAMTGFLHVSGWGESLCRILSQASTTTIFKAYHPDSRWLACVGLSWLPRNVWDDAVAERVRELRALGLQIVASAYRQWVAYRQNPREQQRYMSLSRQFAREAQQFRARGGVNEPFLETFKVLENPDQFLELPWKSQELGLTEALEIANAGIMAKRFCEAQSALDSVVAKIPTWHLPVRSRAVRLELACRLALGRPSNHISEEAHDLCALLPHDFHMLSLVEHLKGDLRRIYRN